MEGPDRSGPGQPRWLARVLSQCVVLCASVAPFIIVCFEGK